MLVIWRLKVLAKGRGMQWFCPPADMRRSINGAGSRSRSSSHRFRCFCGNRQILEPSATHPKDHLSRPTFFHNIPRKTKQYTCKVPKHKDQAPTAAAVATGVLATGAFASEFSGFHGERHQELKTLSGFSGWAMLGFCF